MFAFIGLLKKTKCRKQNIRGPIKNVSVTHKWVPTQCLGNNKLTKTVRITKAQPAHWPSG